MTKKYESEALPENFKDILRRHTQLGASKVVSYLPLDTIENVMGMPLQTYTSILENNGASYLIFGENECCISSGAVYAFLPEELSRILGANHGILATAGIPCDPTGFIQAISGTWFENGANILPLLRELFGEV